MSALERPIRQRVFAALLAIAVLVDLSAYDPARFVLRQPRQFHMPWLPLWPELEPSLQGVLLVRGATVLACFGASALFWGRRWGAWLVLGLYGYLFLDHQPGYTNNGYLLLCWLGVAGVSELRGLTPVWPRRVGQITLCAMYLGAGACKLDRAFLSGEILQQGLLHYGQRYEAWGGPHAQWLFAVAACMAAALELALCVGLWWRPRLFAPLGLLFHLTIEVLMPVRFFLWMCAAGYALFLDEPVLEALVARLRARMRPALWLASSVCAAVLLESPAYGVAPSGLGCVILGMAAATWALARRPTPPSAASVPAPALGLGSLCAVICLQAACLLKPALGGSKRFAWQMFSEVLILRIDPQVHTARGYRSASFPNADTRYRTDGFRYHFTSWSEERIYLQGYADWLARSYGLRDVRVVARYRLNGAPEQQALFHAHNPGGTDP